MRSAPPQGAQTRVLMLAWEYPPRIVGGLAMHVAGLSQALARRGVDVTVLTPGGGAKPRVQVEEGVRVVRTDRDHFRTQGMLPGTAEMNAAFLGLAGEYAQQADLVHAHDWMTTPAALRISGAQDVPLVATFHSTELGRASHLFRTPQPDPRIQALEAQLYRAAREVITPSTAMAEELQASFGEKVVQVVPNGIDLPPSPTRRRVEPERMLFAGRLVQEKGVWHLLHALRRILAQHPRARLAIAGVGPERAALRREVENLGIGEAVEFLGKLTPEALADERERAEVAVVPSLYEPFGLVALEAMAWGVPLVASAVGGLQEFTEGAALLVPPANASALAAAIVRIFADRGLQRSLSAAGQHRARSYTWDASAERTVQVYRRARRSRQ